MERSTVISREAIKEGEVMVIRKTTEERLTKMDLINKVDNITRQKNNLIEESRNLKNRYDEVILQLEQSQTMLAEFEDEEIVILQG